MSKLAWCTITALAVIVIFLISAPSASAQPDIVLPNTNIGNSINGVIHCHTTFSDGIYTVEEVAQIAKNHGAKFLVVTDHFEDIDIPDDIYDGIGNPFVEGLRYVRQVEKQDGIENYIKACRNATNNVGILVVPGVEVGIGNNRDWVYDPAGDNNSDNIIHMLGIGAIDSETARRIDEALGLKSKEIHPDTVGIDGGFISILDFTYSKEQKNHRLDDAQDTIARIMDEAGLAVVIAHPYLADMIHGFHYTIYKNRMDHVHGIEFFNGSGTYDEKALEAIGFINRDELMGPYNHDLAPTAGCDFHGIPGTGGEELFDRQTILSVTLTSVWNDNNFESGCKLIADAIRGNGTVGAIVKDPKTKEVLSLLSSANNLDSLVSLANQVSIYQKGNRIFGGNDADPTEELDEEALVYVHAPERAMIRLSMSDIDNTNQANDLIPPEDENLVEENDRIEPSEAFWIFMVDKSTSMTSKDNELIRQIANHLQQNGLPGDRAMALLFSGRDNVASTKPSSDSSIIADVLTEGEIDTDNGTAILDAIAIGLILAEEEAQNKPIVLLVITDGEEWTDGILKDPGLVARKIEQSNAHCILALTDNARKTNDPINELLGYDRVVRFDWTALEKGWQTGIMDSYTTDTSDIEAPDEGFVPVFVTNNYNKDVRLYFAWHDKDGWHNRDWKDSWKVKARQKDLRLTNDDGPIFADKIMYWAITTDEQGGWRTNDKDKVIEISRDSNSLQITLNN